uniref:Reverse transcriptase zinc-binding domain-containing protein n=1 Tax=Brassica oleracea TaxID=3712 RepID=A0A3P6DEQ8_BRAOL|nr:unnamed protein product [Brassica oleracea]
MSVKIPLFSCSESKVPWHCLVWFPQAIPRQSFMVWLTFKERLSTGVRMRDWRIEQGCVYYGERNEDRDHLLFACPHTFTLYTITTLLQSARNRLDTILLRLVFQTSIYVQWKERRHGSAFVSVDMTTRAIGKLVKNHISSLKYMGNHKPEGLLRRWFEVYPF